jgi:osmotically inducible protein OsmC
MAVTKASAVWEGNLTEGSGTMDLPKGGVTLPYTRASRFADGAETNPEELIGAAHAGCYSMFLSSLLSKHGTPPTRISTSATVTLGAGPTITGIALETEAEAPGIDADTFARLADEAKQSCPVSKALASVDEVTLKATLL